MIGNAAILGLVAALGWGLHDFIGRFTARAIGQVTTAFGVMVAGFLLLGCGALFWGNLPALTLSTSLLALLSGAAYGAATALLFAGYRIGSMSIVSPLVGCYPAIVVAYNILVGVRPDMVQWLAMAAVIIGSIMVASQGPEHEKTGHVNAGKSRLMVVYASLSACCFAIAIIIGQSIMIDLGEFYTTWIGRLGAVLFLLPLMLIERKKPQEATMSIRWVPVILVMGAFDTLAIFSVIAAGDLPNRELAAVTGGSFGVIVSLAAWLFLREPVSARQWLAIAIAMMGAGTLALYG